MYLYFAIKIPLVSPALKLKQTLMKHEVDTAIFKMFFCELSHAYKGVCLVSTYSLKKSSKTDISATTTRVKKEDISSALEMPVCLSQITPPHLPKVARILDFQLIIHLFFFIVL